MDTIYILEVQRDSKRKRDLLARAQCPEKETSLIYLNPLGCLDRADVSLGGRKGSVCCAWVVLVSDQHSSDPNFDDNRTESINDVPEITDLPT